NLCGSSFDGKGCCRPDHSRKQKRHVSGRRGLSRLPQYSICSRIWYLSNNPVKAVQRHGRVVSVCQEWIENLEKMMIDVGSPPFKGAWLYPKDCLKPMAKDNFYWKKPESDLTQEEEKKAALMLDYYFDNPTAIPPDKKRFLEYIFNCIRADGAIMKKNYI